METDGPLTLLYLDRHCAVVDKPGGLLAVPGRGADKQDCVVTRLKRLCPWCIEQPAAHRLDMATSGLMVLGMSREGHRNLSRQFADRLVHKVYVALLAGRLAADCGAIRLAFRLDPEHRPYQVYDPVQGKLGITLWQKLASYDNTTLVALWPQTGRTHQLRLHASHALGLGAPIAGDPLYGHGACGDRLCLHATHLHCRHPIGGWSMRFSSQAPFLHAKDIQIPIHFAAASLEQQAKCLI